MQRAKKSTQHAGNPVAGHGYCLHLDHNESLELLSKYITHIVIHPSLQKEENIKFVVSLT